MKLHTSLLRKGIRLWPSTGYTQRQIDGDISLGCHQQEGKILSLSLSYAMTVNYHIAAGSCGILVSFQDGIRLKTLWNWVRQCVSAVREAQREKGSGWERHGAWCGPNRMAEYTLLTCQGRVLGMGMLAFCLILATKIRLHFICFISASDLLFPNCVWVIQSLVTIDSLH